MSTNSTYLTDEETFFYQLLETTKQAFANSDTRKKHPNENWNFAICETPIKRVEGLVFGLNWGGDDINQQSLYPPERREYGRNWKFVTHSRKYFREHFDVEIEDLNYSNLCFFRSPDMKRFVPKDWKRGIPLFEAYVKFVEPSWCMMMGNPNPLKQDHIKDLNRETVLNEKGNRKVYGYTGLLFGEYPFGCVPHPGAHISSNSRNEIWEKVMQKMKSRYGQ